MRRITLALTAVLLAAPLAHAKTGVELQKDPASMQTGEKTQVTMLVMREPRGPSGEPQPIAGVRPLATFRSSSTGQRVRVRGSRTDRDGIATATVAFPTKGEWTVAITAPRLPHVRGELQRFQVGAPTQARPPSSDQPGPGGGFPWLPVLIALGAVAALGAGAVRFGPRRLRARLPAWLGGGA